MRGSINHKAKTHPIINGASYLFIHPDGKQEFGSIMGSVYDAEKDVTWGYMYSAVRGPIPQKVQEGTESMAQWKLISIPSEKAAKAVVTRLEAQWAADEKAAAA